MSNINLTEFNRMLYDSAKQLYVDNPSEVTRRVLFVNAGAYARYVEAEAYNNVA